jgi:hypothetical protein
MRVRKFTSWALLFVLLFTSLLLGVNPLATIAQTQGSSTSPIEVQRLGGLGRYDTSAEINKYGWQKASTYAGRGPVNRYENNC